MAKPKRSKKQKKIDTKKRIGVRFPISFPVSFGDGDVKEKGGDGDVRSE